MTPEIQDLIDNMKRALRAYDAAADKFIRKVQNGEARSVETYSDLRVARELSKQAIGGGQ